MAERYQFGNCLADVDVDATRAWYARAGEWNCACGDCQNFLALARAGHLPGGMLSLLGRLGIPPEKATYVCMTYRDDDGRLWYDLSYRLAGRIVRGEDAERGEVSCFHETYPYGAPGFPEPHFDLGFWYALPWALERPRGEE